MTTERIDLTGKVLDYLAPEKVPGKHYYIAHLIVECPILDASAGQPEYAYYCLKKISSDKIFKFSRNATISCTVLRDSKIWQKNGNWQTRDIYVYDDGEKRSIGKLPIILDSYKIVSEIIVENTEGIDPIYPDEIDEPDDLPF